MRDSEERNESQTHTCGACGREFDSEEELEDHICNEGQVY